MSTDEITGLSDAAVGSFVPDNGSGAIAFGPSEANLLSDVLALGLPGAYQITAGDEDGQVGDISFSNFEEINFGVLCFARGTRLLTELGERRVEDLRCGDLVWTLDQGWQPIRWHGVTRLAAEGRVAPVRFATGAAGNNRPLIVSPHHRMLLRGPEIELLFGLPEAFCAAHMLVDHDRVRIIEGGVVEYHHVLLDRHGILFSEGALSESYLPGDMSWEWLTEEERTRIQGLFPEIANYGPTAYGSACRPCLKRYEVQALIGYRKQMNLNHISYGGRRSNSAAILCAS